MHRECRGELLDILDVHGRDRVIAAYCRLRPSRTIRNHAIPNPNPLIRKFVNCDNAEALYYLAWALDIHRWDAWRQAAPLRSMAVVEPVLSGLDEEAAEGRSDPRITWSLRSCRGSRRVRA